MATYYIDSLIGLPDNNGKTETSPLETHVGLDIKPGDTILFRRGTSYRQPIDYHGGDGEAVTFGAYGNGDAPVFFGSINRSERYLWAKTEQENIWKLAIPLLSSPCNLVFDFGDHCGTRVWEQNELLLQGQWQSDSIGNGSSLYIYSEENPGEYYRDIEVALDKNFVFGADKNAVFDGLCVMCTGGDGFFADSPKNIHIKDCRFEFIGGIALDKEKKIRGGNGVSFIGGAENCLVEDCIFYNIYDSGVYLGGGGQKDIKYYGNTFDKYGMAAFETSGEIGENILFELNVCSGAGHGFSLGGEKQPRRSRIYPMTTGYHVFAGDIKANEMSLITVRRNIFRGRPTGDKFYIGTDNEEIKNKIIFENNEFS